MLEDEKLRNLEEVIKERHIDWNSINASHIPILDVGSLITAIDVDGALTEIITDLNGFPNELKGLTQVEIQQLENINTVTISNAQWAYLGELDQSVKSGSAPTFTANNFSDGGSNAIITITQETNFETAYSHSQIISGNPHDLNSEDIEMLKIGTPTKSDLQDLSDVVISSGRISGGNVSDDLDGTITVAAGEGIIKTTDSQIGANRFITWVQTPLTPADNDLSYVYVDYSIGSPVPKITTNYALINGHSTFSIARVYREGTTLHICNCGQNAYNIGRRGHKRAIALRSYERASGLVISESATRQVAMTAGIVYRGYNKIELNEKLATTNFRYWYHSGGSWTSTETNQISNTQYDNGTNLATVSVTRYGVHWVFIDFDDHIHIVYGRGNYKLEEAENALVPDLPPFVEDFSVIIGKIIIRRDATTFESVRTSFEIYFSKGVITEHNSLANIQGGTTDEYYHLTSAQHVISTQAATTSLSGYLSSSDWNTFNGKVSNPLTANLDGGNYDILNLGDTKLNTGKKIRWMDGTDLKAYITNSGGQLYFTSDGELMLQPYNTYIGYFNASGLTLIANKNITLSGTGTIAGILHSNLLDKSAAETITGIWSFNPKIADGSIDSAAAWNAKQDALIFGIADGNVMKAENTVVSGEIAKFTATGLEGQSKAKMLSFLNVADGANNYTHPSGDGNLHVIATSTTNDGKVLTAGATAGSLSWTSKGVNLFHIDTKDCEGYASISGRYPRTASNGSFYYYKTIPNTTNIYINSYIYSATGGAAIARMKIELQRAAIGSTSYTTVGTTLYTATNSSGQIVLKDGSFVHTMVKNYIYRIKFTANPQGGASAAVVDLYGLTFYT